MVSKLWAKIVSGIFACKLLELACLSLLRGVVSRVGLCRVSGDPVEILKIVTLNFSSPHGLGTTVQGEFRTIIIQLHSYGATVDEHLNAPGNTTHNKNLDLWMSVCDEGAPTMMRQNAKQL